MAKVPSMAVKVEMLYRFLNGELAQELAPHYNLSSATIQGHIKKAGEELASLPDAKNKTHLQVFFGMSLASQRNAYPRHKEQIDPLCLPFISAAEKEQQWSAESNDRPVSTKISGSTLERFSAIVDEMRRTTRPDASLSSVMRELIEDFVDKGSVQAPTVKVQIRSQLRDELLAVLDKYDVV